MVFVLKIKGVSGSYINDKAYLHSFDDEDDADNFIKENNYDDVDNSFVFANKIIAIHHFSSR